MMIPLPETILLTKARAMISTPLVVLILSVGIVAVVGGVLVLRLHAFLALILAALLVAVLTPPATLENYSLEQDRFTIQSISDNQESLTLTLRDKQWLEPEMSCMVLRWEEEQLQTIARLRMERIEKGSQNTRLAVMKVVSREEGTEIHPGDFVVTPQARKKAVDLAKSTVGSRVAEGFGNTCKSIGILIAMASIIGICLLESGAADRIVRSTLKLLGEKGAPISFISSGFLLGIPVFFDTVFYLMIPLGKAMRLRTGRNYLLYVMTIIAGATMAHSLVPPTPGPLFVAEQLNVDIGLMILMGCAVGLVTVIYSYFYASIVCRFWELPLRESPDFPLEDLEKISQRDESELPPLWLALLPILLPVVLIGGFTILKSFSWISADFLPIARQLGDKNLALVLSAIVAMGMLLRQKRTDLRQLAKPMQSALASGGVIILITAAGGAFGATLQQTGVSGLIRQLPGDISPVMILTLAFLITLAIRTAQGSSTVAMITAVGILSGISSPETLGFHPVYLALAIGCGSKPFSWMNDSGFWVITKMSGMTESEGLKYITPLSGSMGFVGLFTILIAVQFFRLV